MLKIAKDLIRKHSLHDSFYTANLEILRKKIKQWHEHLPMIEPFYAIKCNPDKEMISIMIKEGMGFDCASKNEIKTVMEMGVSTDNIIYAHPVKRISDLIYARDQGIKYTTFDSISELEKMHKYAPEMKCVIRLKVDNPSARVQLGLKYGVAKNEYKDLIDAAWNMKLDIVGTSFHVGSASKDPEVFSHGIKYCREVFDYARSKGFLPNLLDVGGGFTKETFIDCASVLRKSIKKNFNEENIRIISEPGRLFAQEVFTLFTPVIGQRKRDGVYEYWLMEGLYNSFNCILYDDQVPTYDVLRNPLLQGDVTDYNIYESMLFGQTCDSADKLGNHRLPYLRNGDFIMVKDFGAYTLAGSCDFNGLPASTTPIYYID